MGRIISTDEFERIKTEINSKLPQYIEAMGFAIKGRSGSIRCPNKSAHKHGDRTPSASMWIGNGGIPVWFCHQCSSGTDLFEFARYAEPDLPMHGSAFVTKTIPHLCETLGIPFSIEELSPRIKERIRLLALNEEVAFFVSGNVNHKFLESRNIPAKIAESLQIGGGIDYDSLVKYLGDKNFTREEMEKASIVNWQGAREIFSEKSLIFALQNENKEVVGFAARNMEYEKEKLTNSSARKYINTPNNSLYKKSNILYMPGNTVKAIKQTGVAYIFEGYTDVTTAISAELTNVCAVCTSGISEEQLTLLKNVGATKIYLCLDADKTGKDKTRAIIARFVSRRVNLSVRVIEIDDEEANDPDTYIRKHGRDAFLNLPVYDIVEYELKRLFPEGKDTNLANDDRRLTDFLRWICKLTKSPIMRQNYAETVGKHLGMDFSLLMDEMDYASKVEDDKLLYKADTIWNKAFREGAKNSIHERIEIAERIQDSMFSLSQKSKGDIITNDVDDISSLKIASSSSDSRQLKTGFERLDYRVKMPLGSGLVVLGAYANRGKSTFMRQLACNIVEHNPDVMLLYCSLDDSKADTIAAMIALKHNLEVDSILFSNSPDRASVEGITQEQLRLRIRHGYEDMERLAREGRLIVKDQGDVQSILQLKEMIEVYVKRHCKSNGTTSTMYTKHPVMIIDSIHSLMDVSGKSNDLRSNTINSIQIIKKLCTKYRMPIYAIAELRKGVVRRQNYRPSLADIAETVRIEYLSDVCIIMNCRLSDVGPSGTELKWQDERLKKQNSSFFYPIIELDIQKNKKGYFKGSILHKFHPPHSKMSEVPKRIVPGSSIRSEQEYLKIMWQEYGIRHG